MENKVDKRMSTKEEKIEKEDTKNLFGFWAIELVPSLIFIGALSMALDNHFGIGFLFDSLEITASLGVILKIAKQEMNVAKAAKNPN